MGKLGFINDCVVLLWEDTNVTYQVGGIVHLKTVDARNYLVQAGWKYQQAQEYLDGLLDTHMATLNRVTRVIPSGVMAPDPYN